MLIGILCGLSAALGQSMSYLATRHYVQRRPAGASRQLLVLGHVWMGIFGLILLGICEAPGWSRPAGTSASWGTVAIPWGAIAWPYALYSLGYVGGQLALTSALKHAEASRVSPLMTSKLIVSSILVMIYGQPVGDASRFLTPLQWVAVLLCTIAGLAINFSGGRMKTRAMLSVAVAAISFSLSDWGINLAIRGMLTGPGMERLHASLLTQALAYLITGVMVLPLLPGLGSRQRRDWMDAFPFAFTWFSAMIGLFFAFSLVGILLGSILQCTRGFITIVLGAMLMHLGHHHIEPLAPRRVLLRRLTAGVLMFAGISLYVMRDPATIHDMFRPAPARNPR